MIRRTRVSGDPTPRVVNAEVKMYNKSDGKPLPSYRQTGLAPPRFFSYISDEKGGIRGAFKECFHNVFWCVDKQGSFRDTSAPGDTIYENTKWDTTAFYTGWMKYTSPLEFAPSEAEIEAFNGRAYQAIEPGIQLAMDMPTFLAELGGLKDLFNIASLGEMGKFWRNAQNFVRENKKLLVRDHRITESLAGDYLNYQFGWKPTFADAKALYKTITTMHDQLAKLIRKQGQVLTSHYSETVTLGGETRYEVDKWKDRLEYFIAPYKLKLTATMKYTYSVDNLKDMDRQVLTFLAYLDALGFNNPLRTIWERIPFSFILDWFIPVGEFLEQFSMKWIDTTVNIMDYMVSYSTTTEDVKVTTSFRRYSGGATWEVNTMKYRLYCRRRMIPNTDTLGLRVNSRFGSKQLCLSGALATTFFGRR